ncbi:MAG: HAD family hydrolase, partial [Kiritimatiellae bacterium]|nr:HAD family hydrolase [Kiritimatiellia bacterium]
MRPAILFDIDGTLLHARGVGRGAFDRAFSAAYGVDYPDIAAISFIGATDLGVVREMAEACGVPSTPAREEHFFLLLARYLDEGLTATPPHVYPGVPELLRALTARGIALGLVTGNIRPTSWSKIRHEGVVTCFTFVGYGDDDPDR